MRGKVGAKKNGDDFFRITPAYAGKSGIKARDAVDRQDHPRICGEKWYGRIKDAEDEGSPPHMRGKV